MSHVDDIVDNYIEFNRTIRSFYSKFVKVGGSFVGFFFQLNF
jgi:hypothetical protein